MSRKTICVALAAAFALAVAIAIPASAGVSAKAPPDGAVAGTTGQLQLVGSQDASIPASGASYPDGGSSEISAADLGRELNVHQGAVTPNAPGNPKVKHPNPVTTSNPGLSGWAGVSHFDQRNAGTGAYANTQFSSEPPDQALCVGNGFVIGGVNAAFDIYKKNGTLLVGPVAYNQFYGLAPETDRVNQIFGDFTSDPKCLYDEGTGRFFMTMLQENLDPSTGAFSVPTSEMIAVSKTSNPTGGWWIYRLITTNDGTNGTPVHPSCPCLGDQPLIGTDAHGFFISTNEFPVNGPGFNGAQIYAMSKVTLEAGAPATYTLFSPGDIAGPGATSYSVQPATVPKDSGYDLTNNGTEWFLSAGDFDGTSDNRIFVWALSSTDSLAGGSHPMFLVHKLLKSEAYSTPPAALQKDCTPLPACRPFGGAFTVPTLETNDDRMNQVVYASGALWSGVNTGFFTKSDPTVRAGIAYFVVSPSITGHGGAHTPPTIDGSISNQGYVAVSGQDVLFPSIGASPAGNGVMGFTLAGPGNFPSSAYTPISRTPSPVSPVHNGAAGTQPADGFTGYSPDGPPERWGDYSAAVWSDGAFWFASEYVNSSPRTSLANWDTFVGTVPG